jgi:23S rRNA (uridine2552-2'-O)-methyltransferase
MLRRTISLILRQSKQKSAIPKYFFSKQSKTSKPHSRKWTKEFAKDPYVKKARNLDYRSRSSFKLLEIESRFKLITKSKRIIEIGCFPGGWSQILQEHAGNGTKIIGVDLLKTQKLPEKEGVEVKFIQGDALKHDVHAKISEYFKGQPVNLIVCDISPSFVGELDIDHHNISDMNIQVLSVCEKLLMIGGNLVIKTLHGTDERKIHDLFGVNFKSIRRVKPGACRAKSAEMYYVCFGYKNTEFWRKLSEIDPKERTVEKMMDLMPEHLKMTGEEIKRAKETLKYQLMHNLIDEKEMTNSIEKNLISELKVEMEKDNFVAKNKKEPVYTMDDLSDMYDKFCEENNYKYSYTIKLPKTLHEVKEIYEREKPFVMKEIQEMMELGRSYSGNNIKMNQNQRRRPKEKWNQSS